MSEKRKKVIYVDDLVIKADNVFIEPRHQPKPRPPFNPFFGPRRDEVAGVEDKKFVDSPEIEDVEDKDVKEDVAGVEDHKPRRSPW